MPFHAPDVALSLVGNEMETMRAMLVAPHISEKMKRNGEPYVPTRYVRPLELPSLPGKYRRLGDDHAAEPGGVPLGRVPRPCAKAQLVMDLEKAFVEILQNARDHQKTWLQPGGLDSKSFAAKTVAGDRAPAKRNPVTST